MPPGDRSQRRLGVDARVRVLLVDDEPELRAVVRHALERTGGFEIVGEAADGDHAVSAAAAHLPDVVLLDILMPVTSGERALPHILTIAPRSMVAVLTASREPDLSARLRSLGAFACYRKTALLALPELLQRDYDRFREALQGDDVVVSWDRAVI